MAKFPEQFIQQVLQSTDIVELIGRYVSLQKKGKEFVGLCPFHDDSNPSMYVSPAKQIYKCFACGSGGNALQFVMNFEKQSFPEAVKILADLHSIPLPRIADASVVGDTGTGKADLLKVAAFAAEYFKRELRSPRGTEALAYARGRGLTDESIERFDIGYASDAWQGLIEAAAREGFNTRRLTAAGLCRRSESGRTYDYFRNRLIFPIRDTSGRTVAFGGRALSRDEKAKYINSPQTPLYDKSSLVYPIEMARKGMTRSGRAVVVEGYLDALMPHQEGLENVVATLGTSLTERHVRLLARYAKEAVLVFDADVAGASAAERAIQLFLDQRLHIRIAEIPTGKDPCDYVVTKGGAALKDLVEKSEGAIEFVWNRKYAEFVKSGDNIARRNEVIDDFLRFLIGSGRYSAIDPVRRQNFAQHVAHLLNLSAADLQTRIRKLSRRPAAAAKMHTGDGSEGVDRNVNYGPEREVIEVLLHKPELFDTILELIDPDDFRDPVLSRIASCMWSMGEEGRLSLEELMGKTDMIAYGSLLADMAMASANRKNHEQSIMEAVNRIVEYRDRKSYTITKDKYLSAEERNAFEKIREVHENENNVLRKFKGIAGD